MGYLSALSSLIHISVTWNLGVTSLKQWRAKTYKATGRTTEFMGAFEIVKAYVYGFLVLLLVLALAFLVTVYSQPMVSLNPIAISQNTIQLDVILFGFSAVMFGLISTREQKRIPEGSMFEIAVVASASFLCYLVSLGLAVLSFASANILLTLFSAWIPVFGVGISTLYVVMLLLAKPPSTNAIS